MIEAIETRREFDIIADRKGNLNQGCGLVRFILENDAKTLVAQLDRSATELPGSLVDSAFRFQ